MTSNYRIVLGPKQKIEKLQFRIIKLCFLKRLFFVKVYFYSQFYS